MERNPGCHKNDICRTKEWRQPEHTQLDSSKLELAAEIRNIHKKLRNEMSLTEVQEKSSAICKFLQTADWYADSATIYGYYPLGNEVNCLPFLKQALMDGKRVALPKTLPGTDCRMEFYEIRTLSQVAEGSFHVMEPTEDCPLVQCESGSAQEEGAIVLVPGVVFDKSKNRYGYGRGYYDRYFARYPKLRRMALAYENQIVEKLSVSKTDVVMERIYTELGFY